LTAQVPFIIWDSEHKNPDSAIITFF